MQRAVRNLGREGLAATAISAVDTAIWDLKARLLGLPLFALLGSYRDAVPIYGSGGFTTYCDRQLARAARGLGRRATAAPWVKMKIGTQPRAGPAPGRGREAAIGEGHLFVDANGAYGCKQALALAQRLCAKQEVGWFEEPVSSDDLPGLRAIRRRAPAGMEIAAGEYGYTVDYFRTMLQAQARRRAAGGRDPLRRHHRLPAGRGAVRGAPHRSLRSLRAGAASPRRLRGAAAAPSRMVSRSRAHRAHAVRRRAVPRDGAIRPDLSRPGHGLDVQAPGCGALCGLGSAMSKPERARSAADSRTRTGGRCAGRELLRQRRRAIARPVARQSRPVGDARRATSADGRARHAGSTAPRACLATSVLVDSASSTIAARSRTRRCSRRWSFPH